jgi:hypothetical protein
VADLYQADLIDLAELQRRAKDLAARRARLDTERTELSATHHDLASHNRLHQRLDDFAARAGTGIDQLDFDGRQRLIRLVVEQVRVTGWQVEIRLRIPLDDNPTDSRSEPPPNPKKPSPKRGTRRSPTTEAALSSDLRLRSAGAVQSFLLSPPSWRVWLGVHEVHAEHSTGPGELGRAVWGAVVQVQVLGHTTAADGGAQHVLAGAGVLLFHEAALDQQAGVVVNQQEELGPPRARPARVGDERSDEDVADPDLVAS